MQEAPTSPAIPRSNKHRIRFYLAAALLTLGITALICISAFIILADYWFMSFTPICMAIYTIVKTPYILRNSHARARIEKLITEFDQITDRFARPKYFRHKAFSLQSPDNTEPKSFIYRLSVSSGGHIRLPEMAKGSPAHYPNHYNVKICINDDVVFIATDDIRWHIKNNDLLISFFDKHSGKGEKVAHFRVRADDVRNNLVGGDFSISDSEFDGFMMTLELAKYSSRAPSY